jgi:hypothetical protein
MPDEMSQDAAAMERREPVPAVPLIDPYHPEESESVGSNADGFTLHACSRWLETKMLFVY